MTPTDDRTLPSSVRPVEPFSLEGTLKLIVANTELAVEYGKSANARLGVLERRLTAIEHHMGLNGEQLPDTEPAPATQPENEKACE